MSRRLSACLITIPLALTLCQPTFAQNAPTPPPAGDQSSGDYDGPPAPPEVSAFADQNTAGAQSIAANTQASVLGGKRASTQPDKDWIMYRHDASHSGYSGEQPQLPLKLAWKFVTDLTPDNISTPAVAEGIVYLCSGGRLYALDAETGAQNWCYPKDQALPTIIHSSPLVGEDLVYFGAGDGKLYAITKADGIQAWSFAAKGGISASPMVSNGIIYVGSNDNHLYALDAKTGTPKWPGGFVTKDDVAATPAISGDYVYFVGNEAVIYAANVTTGELKWAARLGLPSMASTPVVEDGVVYVASGNQLQAFQALNGRVKWTVNTPAQITTVPAIAGGALYFATDDGKLYSVNTSGKAKWKAPIDIGAPAYGSPTVVGNTVFVGADKGLLVAADRETGEVKWKYTALASLLKNGKMDYVDIQSSPVYSNGNLYAATDDGALLCFNSSTADSTPPQVSELIPARDSVMPGAPPVVMSAVIEDAGSGIRPDVTMMLDGKPVEYKMTTETGTVTYKTKITQPVLPLADGRHTVTLTLADWAGNKTETSWSFTVDNSIAVKSTSDKNKNTRGGMPGMDAGMPGMGAGMPGMGAGLPGRRR